MLDERRRFANLYISGTCVPCFMFSGFYLIILGSAWLCSFKKLFSLSVNSKKHHRHHVMHARCFEMLKYVHFHSLEELLETVTMVTCGDVIVKLGWLQLHMHKKY